MDIPSLNPPIPA
ncbi:hypothetical protein RLOC_00014408 [Lonchura striata]|uniref:Uncharacterized protein n=1 Tax=Lonchura striata TaxID=40157 RepID=A0A218V4X2_9PASE|nr:hypothetical protein RLOC_00014408 [Lonchura striata domestica]